MDGALLGNIPATKPSSIYLCARTKSWEIAPTQGYPYGQLQFLQGAGSEIMGYSHVVLAQTLRKEKSSVDERK